jgi:hypothetical protein
VTSVGNATAIGTNQVTRAMEAQGVARSVVGVTGNATANVADIQGTTANTFLGVNGAGTAIAFSTIPNAGLAQAAATTIKGNNTGATANVADLTAAQVGAILCSPVVNAAVTTGSSGTYNTPTCNGVTAKYLDVELVGAGGGGAGSGTTPGSGGNGSVATTFGASLSAGAGNGGTGASGGGSQPATGGDINLVPANGGNPTGASNQSGGQGTAAPMYSSFAPLSGAANIGLPGGGCGAGGSGAGDAATPNTGGGGAGGSYVRKRVFSPSASYSWAVGTGGAGGTAGTSGFAGGAGTAGCMFVTAYFQ